MKCIIYIILLTLLFSCNNTYCPSENKLDTWALTAQTDLSLVYDSSYSKQEWENTFKINRNKIFNSIVGGVRSGKLSAYIFYPESILSIKEFNSILERWDTIEPAEDEDIRNPGGLLPRPVKTTLHDTDIVRIIFNEKIQLDTNSWQLIKKTSSASFLKLRFAEGTGEFIGWSRLFSIKFNASNCNDKSNFLTWAEKSESILPMRRDSMSDEIEWYQTYILDKEEIFKSITNGVYRGKIKAFSNYPSGELSSKDFYNLLNRWDSTVVTDDFNDPNVMIMRPILVSRTADDIAQIKFNEKIEFDTASGTLTKNVRLIHFIGYKKDKEGREIGLKKLFDVKLNEFK